MQEKTPMTRSDVLRLGVAAGLGLASGAFALPAEAAPLPPTPAPQVFNVRNFGAKGDGKTDDTAAVTQALQALLKAGGGRLHFPSGRYRLKRPLVVSSTERLDFTGDGWSSQLLHEVDEPLLLWPEGTNCVETSVRDLAITSFRVKKSPDTAAIACLGGCVRSFFHHLLFDSEGARLGSALRVERVMDTTTISHCLVWGGLNGTGIKVAAGSEVRIIGGRICGDHRRPGRSVGVLLTQNNGGVHIVSTDLIGVHVGLQIGEPGLPSNREVFITHATLDSSEYGLLQHDNAYTSIAGCWAASSNEAQIQIEEHSTGAIMVIAGGTIFNGGAYGKPGANNGMVVKAGSFVLNGVTIRNNNGTGLWVGDKARNYVVSGCRFDANGLGARLGGDHYVFSNNLFTTRGKALVDEGGPSKQLVGNLGLENL